MSVNEGNVYLLLLLSSELKIWVPEPDHSELPALWWDAIADKCLLLGIYKHGKMPHLLLRLVYNIAIQIGSALGLK